MPPAAGPGVALIAVDKIGYRTLEEVRRLFLGGLPTESKGEGDVVLRMIETYDPLKQAVVMAMFEGEKPVTIKMRLEPPFLVDEVSGAVH